MRGRMIILTIRHYYQERDHQGKGNVRLFPLPSPAGEDDGPIQCHERLGGLLKYYAREAA
jgi:putative transposase